jgi:hypothetical protein
MIMLGGKDEKNISTTTAVREEELNRAEYSDSVRL